MQLRGIIDPKFTVSAEGNSIRVVILTDSHNAAVEKSIYFDGGIVRIYVHNLLIPRESIIFKNVSPPAEVTADSIVSYISSLAAELASLNICTGLKRYECLWKQTKGHIDTLFEDTPCFRHLQCLLVIPKTITCCKECNLQLRNFGKEMNRKKIRREKDASKIPNKYLDKNEVTKKLENLAKEIKLRNKAISRLKFRLNRRTEEFIKLDKTLRNDFYNILEKNEHRMSPLQKQFWESQRDALKVKNKCSIRWHPMMIRTQSAGLNDKRRV